MLSGVWQVGKNVDLQIDGCFEDVSDGGRYRHCVKIVFEEQGGLISFRGVEYEEFSKKKLDKYIYSRGGARGGDRTPTSKLTDVKKSIQRIMTSIKDITQYDFVSMEKNIFVQILHVMYDNKEKIQNDLDLKIKTLPVNKGEGIFLTVTVVKGYDELFMGDYEIVRRKLQDESVSKFFDKYDTISKGNGTCYYCKKYTEVYGYVNTYNSYTVNDKEFITGGFEKSNAWRNYPVCGTCAQELENGRYFIEKNMTSKFCGFEYSIIPKLTYEDKEDIHDIIRTFEDYEKKKFSLGNENRISLLQSEADFIEIMAYSKNNMNYNMFIFLEEKAAFKILAFIEDIVPSRLKNILHIKTKIESEEYFKGLKGKEDTTYDMKYSFEMLRHFLPNNKIEGNFDKSFLEIVSSIFGYKLISFDFLINKFMKSISTRFLNDGFIDNLVLEALMNIRFIESLGLFKNKNKGDSKIVIERNDNNKIYLDFFGSHLDTFPSDDKKAVFLTGVLADKLIRIQNVDKKNSPFYSRLNGLKLNEKLIKRVFTEAVNKLNEYGKNYYKELETIIGEYFLGNFDLSDDEASFTFTLGMTLSKKFKNVEEEQKND